jgi:hypothetical protein
LARSAACVFVGNALRQTSPGAPALLLCCGDGWSTEGSGPAEGARQGSSGHGCQAVAWNP